MKVQCISPLRLRSLVSRISAEEWPDPISMIRFGLSHRSTEWRAMASPWPKKSFSK